MFLNISNSKGCDLPEKYKQTLFVSVLIITLVIIAAKYKRVIDEFNTNPLAENPLQFVPSDIVGRVSGMQNELEPLFEGFSRLVEIAER